MATIYICDRCGTFHENSLYHFELPKFTNLNEKQRSDYELCFECIKQLEIWLKNEDVNYVQVYKPAITTGGVDINFVHVYKPNNMINRVEEITPPEVTSGPSPISEDLIVDEDIPF